MPPDRSTVSFSEAIEQGLPLSSHGAKHQPSIARGNACKLCRKRKLKCDGVKPLCGACKRSALAHGEHVAVSPSPPHAGTYTFTLRGDIAGLACEYDDPTVPKKKRASPGSKVAALEAELAELKAMISQGGMSSQTAQNDQPQLPNPPLSSTTNMPHLPPHANGMHPLSGLPPANSTYSSHTSGPPATGSSHSLYVSESPPEMISQHPSPPMMQAWHPPPFASSSPRLAKRNGLEVFSELLLGNFVEQTVTPPSTTMSSEPSPSAGPTSDPLFELFYPGWPRDLPSPDLTMRLVEIYFNRPHICHGMLNPGRFRAAMLLPPTSNGFPHPGLLHIICAIAAMYVSDDFFLAETRYWPTHQTPTEYHASCAKASLDSSINNGAKLFQVAQTVVLLCVWSYTNARFVELWLYCGQATRILTPLGLNNLRSGDDMEGGPIHYKPYLLPPTADPIDLSERAHTFWCAFQADRFASGSTGWATSLDDADINTVLPCDTVPYPTGNLAESPLSPRNSMFFLCHPQHLVGPLQLAFKSVVLLGKVNVFTQRAPHMATGKMNDWGLNDPVRDVRSTDAFKRLDAEIQSFRSSVPREYQLGSWIPSSGQLDILDETRLCLVHGLGHAATILLHEPWVSTLDIGDEGMRKCCESARGILQAVFTLLSTSTEVTLYSPYINYVWAVAGRTFVREIAMKMARNESDGVDELRNHVNTLIAALKAYKTPLGAASASQLQFLADDPLRTLPAGLTNPNGRNGAYGSAFHPHHPPSTPLTGPQISVAMKNKHAGAGIDPLNCGGDLARGPVLPRPYPSAQGMFEASAEEAMRFKAGETSMSADVISGMNGGYGADSHKAFSGTLESLVRGTAPAMFAWEEERNAAGAGRGGGFPCPPAGPTATAPMPETQAARIHELSGSELAGLESLLGM
ncbi:hypothetical protein JCM10207_003598 [Rhodosporidiobolus poonsookiae]